MICRGGISRSLCKYDDALEDFKQSATLFGTDKEEEEDYCVAVTSIADVLCASRHFETALTYYRHVLDIQQRASLDNDHTKRARLFADIGETLCHLNRFDEAKSFLEQSIESWRQFGGAAVVVRCSSVLGDIARVERRFDEAVQFYEQALTIQRDTQNDVEILNRIGAVFDAQGRLDEALAKSRESLAISMRMYRFNDEDDENHLGIATNLRNIGCLLAKQGDFDGAIEYLQRALTIYEKVSMNLFFVFFCF